MQKSILITGASSGIGKAVAYEMARKGYAVALTAPRQPLVDEIREDIKARYDPPQITARALDVTDHAGVFNAVSEIGDFFGRLDIVFANEERRQLLLKFIEHNDKLAQMVREDDKKGFIKEFEAVTDFFGSFATQALEESGYLINRLADRFA